MLKYVAQRLASAVFVVWAAFTATFVLLYALPSDPVSLMLNTNTISEGGPATAADQAALEAKYGFDQPVAVQYVMLLGRAVRGDFGVSIQTGRAVSAEIATALPATVQLAGLGLAIGVALGIALAVAANLVRSRAARQFFFSLPPLIASVPGFLVALMLLQGFAFGLGAFPSRGTGGLSHLVLPALTIGIGASAGFGQVLGRGIRDELDAPFVEVLRTRGFTRTRIQLGHVFKNAFIPSLTMIGMAVGGVFAGAVVTETVFARLGLGRLLRDAVDSQDIPVVQALVVLAAAAYALVNLVVDLLYPALDPRLRRVAAV
ncbi:MAG: ABC transporter permease [Bifidobacteriaceae bacterium]|jgi:peptide/nickel transport system permease protein|nr:ABC transporter permease [Bifidobacteriaceae bacterium]